MRTFTIPVRVNANPVCAAKFPHQVGALSFLRCGKEFLKVFSGKFAVKIPAGIDTGQKMKLRGEGAAGAHGGPAGDLYVVIDVKEHPFFKRDTYDVHCEVPISFVQAALGAEIEVPTLDGVVKLKIPAGTQNAKRFRLRSKGVSHLSARERGDQYVTVNVEVPTKLNGEQKQLLEKFGAVSNESFPESQSFLKKMKDWF